jgi:hypothetical protein
MDVREGGRLRSSMKTEREKRECRMLMERIMEISGKGGYFPSLI